MGQSTWNRRGRRSGGPRTVHLVTPRLTADEALVYAQRERVRAEFGEAGVRRFDAALLARAQEEHAMIEMCQVCGCCSVDEAGRCAGDCQGDQGGAGHEPKESKDDTLFFRLDDLRPCEER